MKVFRRKLWEKNMLEKHKKYLQGYSWPSDLEGMPFDKCDISLELEPQWFEDERKLEVIESVMSEITANEEDGFCLWDLKQLAECFSPAVVDEDFILPEEVLEAVNTLIIDGRLELSVGVLLWGNTVVGVKEVPAKKEKP